MKMEIKIMIDEDDFEDENLVMEYNSDELDDETLAEMDENEDDRDGQYYEYSYGSLVDYIEDLEYGQDLYNDDVIEEDF